MKSLKIFIIPIIASSLLVSCATTKRGEPSMFNGKVIQRTELLDTIGFPAYVGKGQYAEVNSDWVKWAWMDFREEIASGPNGIVKWDKKSSCTFFATSFEAYCQKRYFSQSFHSFITAPGIAVGTIWFYEDPKNKHAVNIIFTEKGLRYFDTQIGKFVDLTDTQISSKIFQKFD